MESTASRSKKSAERYPDLSYCESVHAGGTSKWHVRILTTEGRKLGGGIDTNSLCGLVRGGRGWDLSVPVASSHDAHTCRGCLDKAVEYLATRPQRWRRVKIKDDHEILARGSWAVRVVGETASGKPCMWQVWRGGAPYVTTTKLGREDEKLFKARYDAKLYVDRQIANSFCTARPE